MAKLNLYRLFLAAIIIIRQRRRRREENKRKISRQFWVRPFFLDRYNTGAYESLVQKMKKSR